MLHKGTLITLPIKRELLPYFLRDKSLHTVKHGTPILHNVKNLKLKSIDDYKYFFLSLRKFHNRGSEENSTL